MWKRLGLGLGLNFNPKPKFDDERDDYERVQITGLVGLLLQVEVYLFWR